jgi:hypothetical protein
VAFANEKESQKQWMEVDSVVAAEESKDKVSIKNVIGSEQEVNVSQSVPRCTCSVLDIICQTNYVS